MNFGSVGVVFPPALPPVLPPPVVLLFCFAFTVTVAVAVEEAIALPSAFSISCDANTTLYVVSLVTFGVLNLYVAIPLVTFSALANATNVPFTVPPVTLSNVNPPLDVTFIAPFATGS